VKGGAGRRRFENLAMPIRLVTGLGLPLEYQKCFSKIMIAASKNYMGLNANTGKIEVKGLVGKKRNQCKLIREAFEQQREY
jgi:DNA polymerase elongation subunit (family B)